jgi:glycosyltransferase involved in cell wall biosynthesis
MALLAQGLREHGFEPLICAFAGGPLAAELTQAGLPVETLGRGRWLDPRPLGRLREIIRGFAPDVVHLWRPLNYVVAALAAVSGATMPVAATLQLPDRYQNPVQRWLTRRLGRRVNRWILPCDALADLWRRQGMPRQSHAVIPPGVNLRDPCATAALRSSLRIPADARVLISAGRLESRKGFKEAIWALDILRYVESDVRYLIAGDGPERQRLQQFARDLQLGEQVHFLGWRNDLPQLLDLADIVWQPSLADDVPNVLLEAMAAGKPVVASRLPALESVITHGETGCLVPPGDKPALARQTLLLVRQPEFRQRLGDAARQWVAQLFNAKLFIERHVELYHELARGSGRGRNGQLTLGPRRDSLAAR